MVCVVDCRREAGLWHAALASVFNGMHVVFVPYNVLQIEPGCWIRMTTKYRGMCHFLSLSCLSPIPIKLVKHVQSDQRCDISPGSHQCTGQNHCINLPSISCSKRLEQRKSRQSKPNVRGPTVLNANRLVKCLGFLGSFDFRRRRVKKRLRLILRMYHD